MLVGALNIGQGESICVTTPHVCAKYLTLRVQTELAKKLAAANGARFTYTNERTLDVNGTDTTVVAIQDTSVLTQAAYGHHVRVRVRPCLPGACLASPPVLPVNRRCALIMILCHAHG